MKIIGIVLVRNEDRFIGRVLANIVDFCDTIIVCDNMSQDATPDLVRNMAASHRHVHLRRVSSVAGTHDLLHEYAGGDNWIFGVDGDEIYDPLGLRRMRQRLGAGEFDRHWQIFGNVLNCTEIDEEGKTAIGYLAPPSRSMTKLYNYGAIHCWDNGHGERLHGGEPQFKDGYDAKNRHSLYLELPWEKSDFRCLHACFTWRSSMDEKKSGLSVARAQPIETSGRVMQFLRRLFRLRQPVSPWKVEKYAKGELVHREVAAFLS